MMNETLRQSVLTVATLVAVTTAAACNHQGCTPDPTVEGHGLIPELGILQCRTLFVVTAVKAR